MSSQLSCSGCRLSSRSPLLRDVLGDAEHADHELVRVVPLRLPEVAQPAARAVAAADAILCAGLLAGEQALGAPLHEPQVGRLDQRRPAAQRLDLVRAVARSVGEGPGRPLDAHAAVRLDAQVVHGVRGQAGERQKPDLVQSHGVGQRLPAHVPQQKQIAGSVAVQRAPLGLEADAFPRTGEPKRQRAVPSPARRLDEAREIGASVRAPQQVEGRP